MFNSESSLAMVDGIDIKMDQQQRKYVQSQGYVKNDVLNEANNVSVPNATTTNTANAMQQQSATPAAPTYKWMQVKRNVPKPQSE